MPFSLERFREQRLWKKRIGAWGFWASVVFAVLDATTRLPTAERGAFAFVSLTMMTIFAVIYGLGCKLPLEETIEIARLHDNQLKITDLTRELNVTIDTARKILSALVQKGQAVNTTLPDEFGVTVYVFPELKANKPIPTTPAEWEAWRRSQEQQQGESTNKEDEGRREPPHSGGLMDKQ